MISYCDPNADAPPASIGIEIRDPRRGITPAPTAAGRAGAAIGPRAGTRIGYACAADFSLFRSLWSGAGGGCCGAGCACRVVHGHRHRAPSRRTGFVECHVASRRARCTRVSPRCCVGPCHVASRPGGCARADMRAESRVGIHRTSLKSSGVGDRIMPRRCTPSCAPASRVGSSVASRFLVGRSRVT